MLISYRKLLIILPIITLMLVSCKSGYSSDRINSDKDSSKANTAQRNKSEINNNPITKSNPETAETGKSTASGETTVVPWEHDDKFKSAQEKNDAFKLLAAYRTVLRDPLPGEEYNVHLAARLLAGTVVKPGEVFSQNLRIGPYTESRGFQKGPTYNGSQLTTTVGGGVCKIASALYNVTILSNLPVIERHSHSMPVPYVPYGQDATVMYGAKDFKFKNGYSFPILIWAQGVDNILYIGFYGKIKPSKVQWHHETLKVDQAPKVYKRNTNLPIGKEKLVHEGMDGTVVKSWVTIESSDGTTTVRELGKSYYSPMPHIFEKNK